MQQLGCRGYVHLVEQNVLGCKSCNFYDPCKSFGFTGCIGGTVNRPDCLRCGYATFETYEYGSSTPMPITQILCNTCGYKSVYEFEYKYQYGSTKLNYYQNGGQWLFPPSVYKTGVTKMEKSDTEIFSVFTPLLTSTTFPTGCVIHTLGGTSSYYYVYNGVATVDPAKLASFEIGRMEYAKTKAAMENTCTVTRDCLGLQEEPPGSDEWYMVTDSKQIFTGTTEGFNIREGWGQNYACSTCEDGTGGAFRAHLEIPNFYTNKDATKICAALCRKTAGCDAFSVKTGDPYECCVPTSCDYPSSTSNSAYTTYTLEPVISAEQTRRFAKNPINLCVTEAGKKTNAKAQAPVLKSLIESNDQCNYIITSGTCPIPYTLSACERLTNLFEFKQ